MRKSFLTIAMCFMAVASMLAQEEAAAPESPWKFDGSVGLNAAATGLVNWAAGGKNNVNGFAYGKLHLLYSKDAFAWDTNFDTDFGVTWIDQEEDAFQKSSDNIKLATKFGWEFHKNWYLTALGSFQSQYALGRNYQTGYNNIISKWLAPSYTDISVGIDWKYSVNGADFSLYLSPVAGRITTAYIGNKWNEEYTYEQYKGGYLDLLNNDEITMAEYDAALKNYNFQQFEETHTDLRGTLKDAYGVVYYNKEGVKMYDRNARAELGLSFKGSVAYKYEDFTLSSTIALFTPYKGKGFELETYEKGSKVADTYFQYSNMNRSFGHFDVDWDVALGYQFLKCLQVTVQTNLKYYPGTLIANKDGEVSERVQFRGVIGLGIGYAF